MNYVLQIVDGSDAKEGKIVGNCDIGAKSIVYFRKSTGKSPIKLSSTSPKQPQHVSVSPASSLNLLVRLPQLLLGRRGRLVL